jgi:hypothetical protein
MPIFVYEAIGATAFRTPVVVGGREVSTTPFTGDLAVFGYLDQSPLYLIEAQGK